MIKLIVAIIFITQSSFAGFPPTSAKGQSETNPTTTFFFQAPNNQFSTTSGSTRLLETGNENLLANPSFETGDLTGWTNGSFTFAKVTSIVAAGLASAGFTVTSAATIVTQTITPTIKIAGRNLVASAWVETSTGVPVSVCFMEAGVEKACASATNVSQGWYPVSATFPGVTDGDTIGIRVKSTTGTSSTVYVDDAYLGVLSLGSGSVDTGWANAGATTITGTSVNPTKGTVVTDNFWWRRSGSTMEARIEFNQSSGGSTGTGAYIFNVPSGTGCTIDTTAVTAYSGTSNVAVTNSVGHGYAASGSNPTSGEVSVHSSAGVKLLVENISGAGVGFVGDSTIPLNAAAKYNLHFFVPCQGWTTLNAISPSQAANLWSGYHDNTCSWARTNASYGDPTADASCALVQRQNSNFGTVATYNSAGSALPGIVITPSSSGVYWICATPKIAGATLAATVDARLWDGTTTIAEGESQQQVAADIEQLTICGLDTLTAGTSTTLSLQTKATSGAVTIATNSTNASAVEWSIANVTFSTPSPLLVGAVVNGGQGVSTRFKIQFGGADSVTTCSSGTCTNYLNTGPGATTVVYNGSGVYTLTVPAGTCSSALGCNVISGSAPAVALTSTANTSTTCKWNCLSSAFANATCYGTVDVECTK